MNSFKLDYIRANELIEKFLSSGVMRISKNYSDLELLLSDISTDNDKLDIEKEVFYFLNM